MGFLGVDRERHFPQMHIKLVVEDLVCFAREQGWQLDCPKWARGCAHPGELRSGSPEPLDRILSWLVAKERWALQ